MKLAFNLTATALAVGISMVGITAHAATFQEGTDYHVLDKPDNIKGDSVVVREFFWYGCPHCYSLEPHMDKWLKSKPADVAFFRTPAAMNPVWETNARGFYAAQLMGHEDKTHIQLFDAIHKGNERPFDKASLTNWYAAQGLDKGKFSGLYDSFAVNARIARTQEASQRYGLTGVPAVVVHGKYVVQGENEKVPQVVDFLIDKVRAENKQ